MNTGEFFSLNIPVRYKQALFPCLTFCLQTFSPGSKVLHCGEGARAGETNGQWTRKAFHHFSL